MKGREMDLKKSKMSKAIMIIAVLTAVFLLGTGTVLAFSAEVGDEYEVADGGKIVSGPGDGGSAHNSIQKRRPGSSECFRAAGSKIPAVCETPRAAHRTAPVPASSPD